MTDNFGIADKITSERKSATEQKFLPFNYLNTKFEQTKTA
jgi:hypothetical protein